MTNYVTASGFSVITGIGWEEAGESGATVTTVRDDRITEAQTQFNAELHKTFSGSESDYTLVQRAVSFLAAHLIRLRKIDVVPNSSEEVVSSSPYLKEYKRMIELLRQSRPTGDKPVFHGMMSIVTSDDV